MARKIPWVRVFAEGGVIIVSILLALAADAWWDRLGDRAREADYLEALLVEFEG